MTPFAHFLPLLLAAEAAGCTFHRAGTYRHASGRQEPATTTPLTAREAHEALEYALEEPYAHATLADLAPLLGAALTFTSGHAVVLDSYPDAGCGCCRDHEVETLHCVAPEE